MIANSKKIDRFGKWDRAAALVSVGVVAIASFVLLGCNTAPEGPSHASTNHDDHEHGDKSQDRHAHDDHDHDHADNVHDEQDHDDHEHDETTSITLSPQALKNIGYEPVTVSVGSYERTISLPGMVVERPGRTQIHVSAPLTGIVTRVYRIEGEAVEANSPLFDVRLTHEELVAAQSEFLRLAEELDVASRELARLEAITRGVVAGQRVLDQQYVRQKLEAQLRASRQALLLHDLSEVQIDAILKTRQLLGTMTIRAPAHEDEANCKADHSFHIQKLNVQVGQQIEAGAPLCILADHCQLYIEGTAFEEDAQRLESAAAAGAAIAADLLVNNRREHAVDGLKLLYIADQIDRDSRALHFYLPLPNEVVVDRTDGEHRFLQWRFKPGQRVELRVPVERWEDRIVVPSDAVVSDGAESFVYEQEGDHFHRVPVHVEHRDKRTAVIANDGAVHAGDIIAGRAAFQIHLALKNKSGGAIDPHAGHGH